MKNPQLSNSTLIDELNGNEKKIERLNKDFFKKRSQTKNWDTLKE